MNESEARAALRAQGISSPSPQLVEDYTRVQQAEEWALEVLSLEPQTQETKQEAHSPNPAGHGDRPHPSSESNLEPLLRERGEVQKPAGRRRAGRPRVEATWFPALATRMSDGTPMRKALASLGIHVSQRDLRALYRNVALTAMRREARRKWQREWGIPRKTKTRRPKGTGRNWLGSSEDLRRIL